MSTFLWMGGGKSSKLGSGGKHQQMVAHQKQFFAKEKQKRGDGPGGFKPKRSLQVVAGSMDQFGVDDFAGFASESGPRREAEESRSFVESGYSRQGGSFSNYSRAISPSAADEGEIITGFEHEGAFAADVGVGGESIVSSDVWNFRQSGDDRRYNALGHEIGDFGDNEMMEEDDGTPRKSMAMSPQLRTTTRKRPRQSDVGGFSASSNEAGRGFRLDAQSRQAGNGYFHATKAAANGGVQRREVVRRDDDDDYDNGQRMLPSGDHGSPFQSRTMQDLKGFGHHPRHHQSIHAGGGSAKMQQTSGGTWQARIVDDENGAGTGGDSARPGSSSRRRLSLSPGRHAGGGAGDFASPEARSRQAPPLRLASGGASAAATSAASLPIPSLSAGNDLFDDLFWVIGPDQAQKRHPPVAPPESGGSVDILSKDRNEISASSEHRPSGRSMQPPRPGREWRANQNLFGLDEVSNMEDFEAIPNGRFSNNAIDFQGSIFSGQAKPVRDSKGINASKLTDVMMPSSSVVLDRSGLRASQGVDHAASDGRAPNKGLHNPLIKHAEQTISVRLQPREVSCVKKEHRNLSFSHAVQQSEACSGDGRGGGRLPESDTLEPLSEEIDDLAVNENDDTEDIAQMVAARNHLLITRDKRQTALVGEEVGDDAPRKIEVQLIRDESVPLATLVMPRVTTDASVQTGPELQQQQQRMAHGETATGPVDGAMSNNSPLGSDILLVKEKEAIHTNVVLPLFTLKGTAKFEKKVHAAAAGTTARDENAANASIATGGEAVVDMEVDASLAGPAVPNPGANAHEVKDEVDPDGVVLTTDAQAAVLDMGTDEGPRSPATPAKVKKAEGAVVQGRGEDGPMLTRDDDVIGVTATEPDSAATKRAPSTSPSMVVRESAATCCHMTQKQREDVVERVLMGVIDSMACKVFEEKRKESEDVDLLMSFVDEGGDRFEKRRPSTPRQPKRAHVAAVQETTPPPGETSPRYSPFERPAFMEDALPTSPRDVRSPSPREQQTPAWEVQSGECLSPSL